MENYKNFASNDFYLSSLILASGFPLTGIERNNGKIATFIFDCPESIAEEIISNHWNKTLQLPTRNVLEAIHELKTRLFSGH